MSNDEIKSYLISMYNEISDRRQEAIKEHDDLLATIYLAQMTVYKQVLRYIYGDVSTTIAEKLHFKR